MQLPTKVRRWLAYLAVIVLYCTVYYLYSGVIFWPIAATNPWPEGRSADSTTPEPPKEVAECGEENWSAGNAFWTLFTIVGTYVLQPEGSYGVLEGGRLWRLSPIFALFETLWIWMRMVQGYQEQALGAACAAVLTTRTTIARPTADFGTFLKPESSILGRVYDVFAVFISSARRIYRPLGMVYQYISGESNSTSPQQETQRLPPDTSTANTVPGQQEVESVTTNAGAKISRASLEREIAPYFDEDIAQVERYETGLPMRLVVWLVMVSQFAKLVSVDGATFVRAVCFMYWVSWLTIEVNIILAKRCLKLPQPNTQTLEIQSRWRHWTIDHVLPWYSHELSFDGTKAGVATQGLLLGNHMAAILAHCHFVYFSWFPLMQLVVDSSFSLGLRIWGHPDNFFKAAAQGLITILLLALLFCVSLALLFPIWWFWISHLIASFGSWTGSFHWKPSECNDVTFAVVLVHWCAVVQAACVPLALGGISYSLFWDASFHCERTTKPKNYDWLG